MSSFSLCLTPQGHLIAEADHGRGRQRGVAFRVGVVGDRRTFRLGASKAKARRFDQALGRQLAFDAVEIQRPKVREFLLNMRWNCTKNLAKKSELRVIADAQIRLIIIADLALECTTLIRKMGSRLWLM